MSGGVTRTSLPENGRKASQSAPCDPLPDTSYQRPYTMTLAQSRSVMEVTVAGSLAKRFRAEQQASTMAG